MRWLDLLVYSKAIDILAFIVLTSFSVGSYRDHALYFAWCLTATLTPATSWVIWMAILTLVIKNCSLEKEQTYQKGLVIFEWISGTFYIGWFFWGVTLLLRWEGEDEGVKKDVFGVCCTFLGLLVARSMGILIYFYGYMIGRNGRIKWEEEVDA